MEDKVRYLEVLELGVCHLGLLVEFRGQHVDVFVRLASLKHGLRLQKMVLLPSPPPHVGILVKNRKNIDGFWVARPTLGNELGRAFGLAREVGA